MSILSQYKNLKKIGSSNNSIIYNADNQEALKVLIHDKNNCHSQQCEHLKNEQSLLKGLDHQNIIKSYSYHKSISHKDQSFCCMSLELADLDLFGLIEQTFPQKVEVNALKDLFRQICKGVAYLHKQKICHNDLKLENILLFLNDEGNDMVSATAKIADFGFARSQNQPLSALELKERWDNRSNCSLAPEILRFKKYYKAGLLNKIQCFDEMKAEMFTLGVMLFSAFFLRSPISSDTAHSEDKYYKYFYTKEYNKFWEIKDFQFELKRLESENAEDLKNLKDLIQSLLVYDCNKRLNIEQVLKHKWFQN